MDCYLELRWIVHLMGKIYNFPECKPRIYIYNKGLEDKIKKFGSHSKSRHIDIKTKGLREDFSLSKYDLLLISTNKMIADPLTKASAVNSLKMLQREVFS